MALIFGVPCLRSESASGSSESFRTSILPLLTKAGCNSGACHGAATGQAGFKLSLLGYDPVEDYERITREFGARRVDFEHPETSLLLIKASGGFDHEGGNRLKRQSPEFQRLKNWLIQGAPFGPANLEVASIQVGPSNLFLPTLTNLAQLNVTAQLSDGSKQDVTSLALYTANDDAVAEVSKDGQVRAVGPGLTSIMVRYGGQVDAARVAIPFQLSQASNRSDFPARNVIDEHVWAELERLGVPPSPLSGDAEFLRRVTLDLTGRLPTAARVREFLAETNHPTKRERLIDQLIGTEDFVDYWTMHFADLLLLNGTGANTTAYFNWLRVQVATNTPFDQMVRELITAQGNLTQVGPANFWLLAADPRDLSEHVGRIFLGSQIACARCHTHPADRWTQEDYHRFAAYFARINREDTGIHLTPRGVVEHPKTGKPLSPKPLGSLGTVPDNASQAPDPRIQLAAWMTSADNPLFARTIVNRLWKWMLGRGLVEPVDDLRPTNPPTHPALLEVLAADFKRHGFNLRHTVRMIALSNTYQRTSRTTSGNAADTQLYSHAYLKPLLAPVFADAVAQVTGVDNVYQSYPPGTRAVQLMSPATPSAELDVLGRCLRKRSCETVRTAGGGVTLALHLINGANLQSKLQTGTALELLELSPPRIVEELYFRALGRPPESQELAEWVSLLQPAHDRTELIQDLLWALLNSREFAWNH